MTDARRSQPPPCGYSAVPDRDALVYGVIVVLVLAGALTGSFIVLAAAGTAGTVLASRTLPRGGLLPSLAVALVWSNSAVAVGDELGLPPAVALAPQLILAMLLLSRAASGRSGLVVTPSMQALMLYGAAVLVSGLFAEATGPVTEKYLTVGAEGLLLWLLVVNAIDDRMAMQRALTAMVVVAGFLGALTFFQYATETFTADYVGLAELDEDELDLLRSRGDYTPRLSGPIGEKNRFAQLLVVTLPVALAMSRRRSPAAGTVHLAAAVLIIAGVAVSGSRGAAIGVLATIVVLAAFRVISARSVLVIVAAAVAVLMVLPGYRERVFSVADLAGGIEEAEADGSTLSRLTENLAAVHMFLDHPLFGVGPGGYPEHYEEYGERIGFNVREGRREAHNLYLGIAAELGLLGLTTFLLVFGVVLRDLHLARRATRADREMADVLAAMIAALIAYLTTGIFLHLSFERYLWALLAVADVTARVLRAGAAASADQVPAGRSEAVGSP